MVRKFESKNESKFGAPANDRNKIDTAWRALMSRLAETGLVRSRFWHIGVDQMTHYRFSRKTAVYSLLKLPICLGLPLMLTQMLRPRVHQEYLQITISDFGISEDCPLIRAIATPDPTVFMHRIHKFRCTVLA